MHVDYLDLSTVDFTGTGGPPPAHKFAVSAWTINAVKVVLAADRATDTKYEKLRLVLVSLSTWHAYKFDMREPSVVHKG